MPDFERLTRSLELKLAEDCDKTGEMVRAALAKHARQDLIRKRIAVSVAIAAALLLAAYYFT